MKNMLFLGLVLGLIFLHHPLSVEKYRKDLLCTSQKKATP